MPPLHREYVRPMHAGQLLELGLLLLRRNARQALRLSVLATLPLWLLDVILWRWFDDLSLMQLLQFWTDTLQAQTAGAAAVSSGPSSLAAPSALGAGLVLLALVLNVSLVDPLVRGSLIHLYAADLFGGPVSAGAAWRGAWRRLGPLAVAATVVAVSMVMGSLAFLVPGIYLMLRFGLAQEAIMLEQARPVDAMARSGFLMRGQYWKALSLLGMQFAAGMGANLLLGAAGSDLVRITGAHVLTAGLRCLMAGLFLALYFSARCIHEGFDARLAEGEPVPPGDSAPGGRGGLGGAGDGDG